MAIATRGDLLSRRTGEASIKTGRVAEENLFTKILKKIKIIRIETILFCPMKLIFRCPGEVKIMKDMI